MSSKPKMPVYETIITRTKSAQLKRQLRKKDKNMKEITQSLTKVGTTMKKIPKSPKKSPKKQRLRTVSEKTENNEYYPNNLKRNLKFNKVFLKPKYDLKMIGTVNSINKRKRLIPKRETNSTKRHVKENQLKKHKTSIDNLTMDEVIKITEETHGFDDEDLIEILTCPSPVWWEDSEDERFIEETLTKSPVKTQKQETTTKIETKVIQTVTKSDKFIKKRNKLEHLLGNIKKRINTDGNSETWSTETRNTETNTRKISESTEGDISSMDDDMLRDLENIDIPVEPKQSTETSETCFGNEEQLKEEFEFEFSSSSSIKENCLDSISDTNIKFLDDFDNNDDLVTVYKIIDNHDKISDISDRESLSMYFKKCKNAKSSPKHKSEVKIRSETVTESDCKLLKK